MNTLTQLIQQQSFQLVKLANKQIARENGEMIVLQNNKRCRATHFMLRTVQGKENTPHIIVQLNTLGGGGLDIEYASTEYAELVESIDVVKYLSLINNYQRQLEFLQSVKHADDAATEAAIMHDAGIVIEYIQKIIALGESVIIEQSIEGPSHLYYSVK